MWQVIYKHLNYSHLHWLGIFTVDKEYKRKQFQAGRQRKEMKYKERLKTVGGAADLFQSFRHMSAFLALGTIYLQLLT